MPQADRRKMSWRTRYLLIGGVALVTAVGLIGWHFVGGVGLKRAAWPTWLGEEPADASRSRRCSRHTRPREWWPGPSAREPATSMAQA